MSALEETLPDGYKKTEIGIFPTSWQTSSLSDLLTKIIDNRGKTPPITRDGEFELIETASISFVGLYPDYTKVIKRVSSATYTNWFRGHPQKDDLLISTVGEYSGASAILGLDRGTIAQNLIALRLKNENNSKFVFYWTRSSLYRMQLDQVMMNQAQPSLRVPWLLNFKLPIPKRPEQNAIANALSDMDALLSELESLIAKKQAIKTATMQQLLTGKTRLPQFAFYSDINSTEDAVEGKRNNTTATIVNARACDDGSLASQDSGGMDSRRKGTKTSELGEIPEDWEVSTIAEISLISMQNGLFYEPARKGKGAPLINVSDMYTSAPISVDSLELFNASKAELKTFKAQEGDLFFTRSSIVPSGIAYCNVFPKDDRDVVFDSHLIKVRVNPEIVDYRYVYLNCLAKHSRQHLIANSKTATMTTIDQKAIKSCPVLIPSKEEQTAIATILSDMDNEIQTLEQRLSKTRQIKQGMMQELLTGKTRLPFARLAGESNAD
jgi:type I restriction enzyme S subunit